MFHLFTNGFVAYKETVPVFISVKLKVFTHHQQKLSYLRLENDDQCNYPYLEETIEKGTEQTHIQGFHHKVKNINKQVTY
ncbi:hypothetical protein D3C80_1755890 [compost metagenome]